MTKRRLSRRSTSAETRKQQKRKAIDFVEISTDPAAAVVGVTAVKIRETKSSAASVVDNNVVADRRMTRFGNYEIRELSIIVKKLADDFSLGEAANWAETMIAEKEEPAAAADCETITILNEAPDCDEIIFESPQCDDTNGGRKMTLRKRNVVSAPPKQREKKCPHTAHEEQEGTEQKEPVPFDCCPNCLQKDPPRFDTREYGNLDTTDEAALLVDHRLVSPWVVNDGESAIEIKITNFTIYRKECGHIYSLEELEKHISDGRYAHISGFAKSLLDDSDHDVTGAPFVKDIGVFIPWIFQDDGNKILIGVTSVDDGRIEYYFGAPSEYYKETYLVYQRLATLLKATTQTIQNDYHMKFDKFVRQLSQFPVPDGFEDMLTYESFCRNAKFLHRHIHNFDLVGDAEVDLCLMNSEVGKVLKKISGLDIVTRRRRLKGVTDRKKEEDTVTRTPILEKLFSETLFCKFYKSKKKNGANPAAVDPANPGTSNNNNSGNDNVVARVETTENDEKENELAKQKKFVFPKKMDFECKFHTHSCRSVDSLQFYGEKFRVGDFVYILQYDDSGKFFQRYHKAPNILVNNLSKIYGRIESMARGGGSNVNPPEQTFFHIVWLIPGSATILDNTAAWNEYFFNGKCSNVPADYIFKDKLNEFVYYPIPENWSELGGLDDTDLVPKGKLFVRHWYDPKAGTFYYRKNGAECPENPQVCPSCEKTEDLILSENKASAILQAKKGTGVVNLDHFTYKGDRYRVGDHILLDAESYAFQYKPSRSPNDYEPIEPPKNLNLNDPEYPERYRKSDDRTDSRRKKKGSKIPAKNPYKIGQIAKIAYKCTRNGKINADRIEMEVIKYYRCRDTDENFDFNDARRLLRSSETATVPLPRLRGRCVVSHHSPKRDEENLRQFLASSPLHFFCDYNFEAKSGRTMPYDIKNDKKIPRGQSENDTPSLAVKSTTEPLKALDLFSGCGGLSLGLHQSGFCTSKWAVEFEKAPAEAFKANYPDAQMFEEDCNDVLKAILEKDETLNGQKLPLAGEVDVIIGGPPCQGFSGMNRFNQGTASVYKNSQIVTFFGFVDALRPKFVLMENVRRFVSHEKNKALQFAMLAMLRLGYQVKVGVLQAGCYGVPQNRRRFFMLAAAPGQSLPEYPLPTHSFNQSTIKLNFQVARKTYELASSNFDRFTSGSAVHRPILIFDALCDLPALSPERCHEGGAVLYKHEKPVTYYQRMLRNSDLSDADFRLVTDHVTKKLTPTVAKRIQLIPKWPGADWRDLPNRAMTLHYYDNNNKPQKIELTELVYNYKYDERLRRNVGICPCSEGDACTYSMNQFQTLIPACLPHNGDQYNQWAGLYGRLDYNGYVNTVVTNPEPMGKQGTVLHPVEDRILSVREYGRIQGFPDDFKFSGTAVQKYRQIGNAVPPPLAQAIGWEFVKILNTR